MKRILFVCLALIVICGVPALRAQESSQGVPELNLSWPIDFWGQGENFARDRIYDAETGKKYLAKARDYYLKGYDLIKRYQGVADSPDPLLRNPYKVYVQEQNLDFKKDFSWAYAYFNRSYLLFKEQIQWDAALKQTAEYKDLLRKTLRGMVMTSVYLRNLFDADASLGTYQTFFPEDEQFFVEWKIRVLAMLVEQQSLYDSRFTGTMSAAASRERYKEYARQRLEKEGDKIPAATKEYILDMITPELTYQPYDTTTLSTNFGR